MARFDLTDFEWSVIEPLLPTKVDGVKRVDVRRSGARWPQRHRHMLTTLGDGDVPLADRAYDSDALRIEMAARDAWAIIKPMPNRKRRPIFSTFLYRYR